MGWREGHARPERARGGESWAAAVAADLGGGGHADLRDKGVTKQAEDLLLLDLLGWGVFGRRRDGWAFPELSPQRVRGRAGSTGVGGRQTETKPRLVTYRPQPHPGNWGRRSKESLLPKTDPRTTPPSQGRGSTTLCREKGEKGGREGEGGERREKTKAIAQEGSPGERLGSSHPAASSCTSPGPTAELSSASTSPAARSRARKRLQKAVTPLPPRASGTSERLPPRRLSGFHARPRGSALRGGLSSLLPSVSSSLLGGVRHRPSRAAARSGGRGQPTEGCCALPPLPPPGKQLQKPLQKTTESLVGRGCWTRPDPAHLAEPSLGPSTVPCRREKARTMWWPL